MDWNSSPGVELEKYGSTNRQVWQVENGVPDPQQKLLMWKIIQERIKELQIEPTLGPVKLFPKYEPHKISKIRENRERLIFGVGAVDNIIAAMFFRNWTAALVEKWREIPIKVGYSPSQGGYYDLFSYVSRLTNKFTAADKSQWDWSCQEWEVDVARQVLQHLGDFEDGTIADNIIRAHFGPATLVLGKAEIEKKGYGVMFSGTYFTLTFNSLFQLILHEAACVMIGREYAAPACIGDDTVQPRCEDEQYWNAIRGFGHKLKDIVHTTDEFEFAGHRVTNKGAWPVYLGKHRAQLQFLTDEPEIRMMTLASYQRLYACDADRLKTFTMALRGSQYYSSSQEIRNWYHGWESAANQETAW
ncbi:hypothetical protein 2 [Beihai sobemo-like virus 22]|uniref:hypothetical protein 2 n=1 Tax=Beihai sobemo-like virus 22 TaxID=1922694 RepID=UPI00090A4014|nr:hypothetical protein 2 [Beihai sobemo-like virus 22]APG75674.1 hypothetical protein 2 [Beihai sobemo-like virus 22]